MAEIRILVQVSENLTLEEAETGNFPHSAMVTQNPALAAVAKGNPRHETVTEILLALEALAVSVIMILEAVILQRQRATIQFPTEKRSPSPLLSQ